MKAGQKISTLLYNGTLVVFCIVILVLATVKSTVSSFTHDESFSYLNYCHEGFMDLISYNDWFTNNHILNSIGMKYSEKLFGSSELALRLPNLLALVLYIFYCVRLTRMGDQLLGLLFVVFLCANTSLMDLFGLARGYGLSFGFMLMSLFHFINYLKTRKQLQIYLFHFAALMASLSSFTMVIYYVAMLCVYNLVCLVSSRTVNSDPYRFIKINKVHLVPLTVVGIIMYEPLRRVITYGDLNFGGKSGFYTDTLFHLATRILQAPVSAETTGLVFKIVFTAVIIYPLVLIVSTKQSKRPIPVELVVTTFLLFIIPIIITLQHYLLGSDFPVSRFAVFLFPLFVLHVFFVTRVLVGKAVIICRVMCCVIAIIALTWFALKWNLYTVVEWEYDAQTKEMINTLTADHEKNGGKSVKLGINWLFEPTVNYYRITRKLTWLQQVDRKGIQKDEDYFYIFTNDLAKCSGLDLSLVKYFKTANTLLLKERRPASQ